VRRVQGRGWRQEGWADVLAFWRNLLGDEEAIIADLCRHPHVVRLVDAFETKSMIHLVYEHGGVDLGKRLAASRSSSTQMRTCIAHVLAGLLHLHEQQLIHADIKPANILVAERGEEWHVLVADVGNVMEVVVIQFGRCLGYLLPLAIRVFEKVPLEQLRFETVFVCLPTDCSQAVCSNVW
jgi:serine/threonine protein kinase